MKKVVTNTLVAMILLAPSAYAQDTVSKVIQIKAIDSGKSPSLTYQHKGDAKWFASYLDQAGKLNDKYQTDANTVAALEFLLGGRVGISKNTIIEVTSENSIADGKTKVKRINLRQGGMWAKTVNLKEPLEIQTNGGVMGIKGTEFAIDTQPNGETTVAVLEGAVEVRDPNGKVAGTAKPGDKYTIPFKGVPTVKTYEVQQLREEVENSHREIVDGIFTALRWASWAGINTGPVGYYAGYYGQTALQLVTNPEQAFADWGNSMASNAVARVNPFGVPIPTPKFNPEEHRKESAYPTKLSPDSGPNSVGEKSAKGDPVFRWNPIDGADGYVVLVSKDEKFDTLEWSARAKDGTVAYPSGARPLEKGRYYWRVIPVNDEDKLADGKKASQAYFDVVP